MLDVGCGAGALGEALLEDGRARQVHGIELQSDAATMARDSLNEVFEINLENQDDLDRFVKLHRNHYDVMILADVLEHVREPEDVLRTLIDTLSEGGLVVASIPNIRSTGVLVPLLFRGRFDYRDRGVLDRTHLRFFTRQTAIELLEGTNLEIIAVERSQAWWRSGVRRVAGRLLGDLGTEQFLITARRPA